MVLIPEGLYLTDLEHFRLLVLKNPVAQVELDDVGKDGVEVRVKTQQDNLERTQINTFTFLLLLKISPNINY